MRSRRVIPAGVRGYAGWFIKLPETSSESMNISRVTAVFAAARYHGQKVITLGFVLVLEFDIIISSVGLS